MGWSGKKKSRVCTCFGLSITRLCKIITKLPQPLFFLLIFNIRSCVLALLCQKAKETTRHMSSLRIFPEEYLWSAVCLVFQKWCFIPSPDSRCICTHICRQRCYLSPAHNFQKIQFCSFRESQERLCMYLLVLSSDVTRSPVLAEPKSIWRAALSLCPSQVSCVRAN